MSNGSSGASGSENRERAGRVIAVVALFVVLALAVVIGRGLAGSDDVSQGTVSEAAASAPTEVARPPTITPTAPPISLAVAHTNDTWGYLYPCG